MSLDYSSIYGKAKTNGGATQVKKEIYSDRFLVNLCQYCASNQTILSSLIFTVFGLNLSFMTLTIFRKCNTKQLETAAGLLNAL